MHHHPLRTVIQDLQRHGYATEVPLALLSAAAVAAYLAARFPQQQLPTTLAPWLHQRTDGQPLFLVTLVQALVEQGVLHEQAGGWTMQGQIEAIPLEVPTSLRQLLEQHITRLPSEAQRVLEVASVAGVEFGAAVVAAGLEADATTVEEVCEALAERQLLHPVGVTTWPNGTVTARYAFVHALYQQVVYERLGAGRRIRLHQCLGGCLEAAYSAQAGEIATELAEHFVRGQDTRRAVHYLRQAGDNALTRSAYQRPSPAMSTPSRPWRNSPRAVTPARWPSICASRCAMCSGRWGNSGGSSSPYRKPLGSQRPWATTTGWDGSWSICSPILRRWGTRSAPSQPGSVPWRWQRTLGERGLTVVAQHYLGGVYRSLGDYRRAIECFRMNVACLDGQLLQKHLGLPGLAAVFARSHLVIALAECGAFAEGRAPAEEGVQWPRRPNTPIAGSWPGGPWAF